MSVAGVALIAFVVLTAGYARLAAPTVGESGAAISRGDTENRYLAADVLATHCVFTGEDGSEQWVDTEPRGRSFLQGTTFTPPGQAGTLACDRELRVMSGGAARLAQVAEHEFLIAFPGVVLVAMTLALRPRQRER